MAKAPPVVALCELIAPEGAAVSKQVLLALGDPTAYLARHAKRCDDWWVDETTKNLPWLALVMGLSARRLLCGIDHRMACVDICWNIAQILPKLGHAPKKPFAWFDEEAHENTPTLAFIELCGRALSAHGLALVQLDTGSDSYELTVLPRARVSPAQTLARRAHETIISFSPKRPLVAPLAAAPKRAQPRGAAQLRTISLGDVREVKHGIDPRGPVFTDATTTFVCDLSSWPPKRTKLVAFHATSLATNDRGTTIVSGWSRKSGGPESEERLVVLSGKASQDLSSAKPVDVAVARVMFVGDAAVILPTEPTYRGHRTVKGPMLLERGAKRLSLPEGLPPVKVAPYTRTKFPSFTFEGVARTGSGLDVLVWNGAGFVRSKKRFERAFELGPAKATHFTAMPADGDGFFVAVDDGVREIRRGKAPARRLSRVKAVKDIRAGEGQALLVEIFYPGPSDPACVMWWPTERVYCAVPASLFALRHGSHIDRVGYHCESKLLWSVVDRTELRVLPWSVVESLPRLAEDSGRPERKDSGAAK